MTSQEILASLSKLEQELESIASARVLAEKTVNAYEEVRGEIRAFFSEFGKVTESLNKVSSAFESEKTSISSEVKTTINVMKGQLESLNTAFSNQCNSVLMRFVEQTDIATNSFKEKIETLTSDYSENNTAFKKSIQELNSVQGTLMRATESVSSLKTDIATLQSQLNDSQIKQDARLAEIAEQLRKTGDNHGQILTKLCDDLKKSQDAQDKDLEGLKKSQKSHTENLEAILSKAESVSNRIDEIISSLDNRMTSVDGVLNTVKTNLDSVISKLDSVNDRIKRVESNVSSISGSIDDKYKSIDGKMADLMTVGKSTKTLVIVCIVISIVSILISLFR